MGADSLRKLKEIKKRILDQPGQSSPLKRKEKELLDYMKEAIDDAYLSVEERRKIARLIDEFAEIVLADNRVDREEDAAIERISTTLKMIITVHEHEHPDDPIERA